ncbi:hypothetical protein CPC08DRAFT_709245 [Agrocybe pediades]|nr:hypothetical protein CPC08DRAFT_709245 [Agrocybe pediades]
MTSLPPCTAIENCTIPTDIVLVSSDGERFGSHTKNLGQFTGSFPADIPPAEGEEVPLKNLGAKALALFLRFVHHHCQPDMDYVDFDTLSQLAEAVEMYEVYSATEVCKLQMSAHVSRYPVKVFLYSIKHGYIKLADAAAENIAADPSLATAMLAMLPQGSHERLISAWKEYHTYYLGRFSILQSEPSPIQHPGARIRCKPWRRYRHNVELDSTSLKNSSATRDQGLLDSFVQVLKDNQFYIENCPHCSIRGRHWVARVSRDKVSSFMQFSSFNILPSN